MSPERPAARPTSPARLWLSTRIRFIGPFVLAGVLGWFGTTRLRSAVAASAELARQQADGSQRVQALERQLQELQSSNALYTPVSPQPSPHESPAGIVPWLSEVEHEARRLGWALQSEIGEVGIRSLPGWDLLRIPVRFRLSPADRTTGSPPLGRLLPWCEWIVRHPRRPEILALSVTAGAAGPGKCQMDIELRCLAATP